jgi:hypothetical protein
MKAGKLAISKERKGNVVERLATMGSIIIQKGVGGRGQIFTSSPYSNVLSQNHFLLFVI